MNEVWLKWVCFGCTEGPALSKQLQGAAVAATCRPTEVLRDVGFAACLWPQTMKWSPGLIKTDTDGQQQDKSHLSSFCSLKLFCCKYKNVGILIFSWIFGISWIWRVWKLIFILKQEVVTYFLFLIMFSWPQPLHGCSAFSGCCHKVSKKTLKHILFQAKHQDQGAHWAQDPSQFTGFCDVWSTEIKFSFKVFLSLIGCFAQTNEN